MSGWSFWENHLQMISGRCNFQKETGMDTSNRKALLLASLLLLLLLSSPSCRAYTVSECCRQPSPSCHLYLLLCRSGDKAVGRAASGDAAAGILTLGRRSEDGYSLQSRLQQLLHGQRNQAAGILTMGKRTVEQDWLGQAGIATTLPD